MYTRKNFKKNALRFLMLFTLIFMILLMNSERAVYASEGTGVPGTLGGETQTTSDKDYNLLTIGVAAGDENIADVGNSYSDITGTIHPYNADVVYKNYYSTAFYKSCS